MKERLLLIRILPIAFLVLFIGAIAQIATCNLDESNSTPLDAAPYQNSIEYWTLEEIKQLKKEDILYATTYGNSSKIYLTGGGCIGYKESMTDLYDKALHEKNLPRISQSYIVNPDYSCYDYSTNLRSERKYTVWINGEKVPVSREYNGLVDFLIKPCEDK